MDKLRQLLKFIRLESEHAKRKPSLLAYVNTDSTAITGDDMVGAAKMFEKETGVPSISVDAPGFKGWDVTGCDLAYRALLTKFAKPGVSKKHDSININGEGWNVPGGTRKSTEIESLAQKTTNINLCASINSSVLKPIR